MKFAELPRPGDAEPIVLAEVGAEVVLWSAATAAWGCSCDYRRANAKADPSCLHVLTVGQSLPLTVATQMANALIKAGHGSSTVSRDRLAR